MRAEGTMTLRAKAKNWHIITSAAFHWPMQITWPAPDSRAREIDSISCWERKNLWPFLQTTTKGRNAGTRVVAHCLSQPPIPHPCNPLLQEHRIHSSLSVSIEGHSILLHPRGERHQPVASKSTTPLFKGTIQLSQIPLPCF